MVTRTPYTPKSNSDSHQKPAIIGIYGISGCGKSYLLRQLKEQLDKNHFLFFDGSGVINRVVPGGLSAFKKMDNQQKHHWREQAIRLIQTDCIEAGSSAVVAGHFMFMHENAADGREDGELGEPVYTQADLDAYSHVIYLDVPVEVIAQRRAHDNETHARVRPADSVAHLRKWQDIEKTKLRKLCRENNILFARMAPHPKLSEQVSTFIKDFSIHNEPYNRSCAEIKLDEIIAENQDSSQLTTVVVLDGDKTLTEVDTGDLFWKESPVEERPDLNEESPLRTLFSGPLGYSYTAFRQAALLYEEVSDEEKFNALCDKVAASTPMHAEFQSLLAAFGEQKHVKAVVVTCGLRRVWEKIIEANGLSDKVHVIGSGRIADGFVVTAEVKAALATRLRSVHGKYVCGFGDGPLDMGMLGNAHQAVVVVGDEQTRSKSMEKALATAVENGLNARQVVLPRDARPRLKTTDLPLLDITTVEYLQSLTPSTATPTPADNLRFVHATNKGATKLLMTPMRNAAVSGPELQAAHRNVGRYLATEYLTDILGVENFDIPHVQGGHTDGHRLAHEDATLIVALMRGGEPMALGVSEAFPRAPFLHAREPEDVTAAHLAGLREVVLVDSVVNSGKSIVAFIRYIRNLSPGMRICVVAGVVQSKFVTGSSLTQLRFLAHDGELAIVALRLSENKFTGRGGTDTGNRLFNTTHLA